MTMCFFNTSSSESQSDSRGIQTIDFMSALDSPRIFTGVKIRGMTRALFWIRGLICAIVLAVVLLFPPVGEAATNQPFDSGLPIEITADGLEVLQEDQVAVFKGNVVALQGAVKLRSDVMTVYYQESGGEASQISKILVDGHVFLTTPTETAQGAKGRYDVAKGLLNLTGKVLLTRGQNVIRGDALVYDLNTGKSKVTSAGATVKADGAPTTTKSGRVKALFVPEKKEKK